MNFKNTPHKSIVMFCCCFFSNRFTPCRKACELHLHICNIWLSSLIVAEVSRDQKNSKCFSNQQSHIIKQLCVKDFILFAERRKKMYTNICLCTLLFHKKHIFIFSFAILLFHLFLFFFVSCIHWENIEHYVDGFCYCFRYIFFSFCSLQIMLTWLSQHIK